MFSPIFTTVLVIVTTVGLYALIGPIMLTALRTGRWLARGVVYDREATPVRFRLALWSFAFLLALFGFLSVFSTYWTVVMLLR
jgi:hypothetical protein